MPRNPRLIDAIPLGLGTAQRAIPTCEKGRAGFAVSFHGHGPAAGPVNFAKGEAGATARVGVVIMVAEPGGVAVAQDANVAGADETSVAFQKWRAAAVGLSLAVVVEIRAGDFLGAPDANFVGAVRALATFAPIDEEVIVIGVVGQARGFDGMVPREVVERGVGGGAEAGLGIEFGQEYSLPVGTEGEPEFAVGVQHDARINGVESALAGGADDFAVIAPKKIRGGVSERGIGGEADGGSFLAPRRDGIIEEKFAVHADDVRRPNVAVETGHGSGRPRGRLGENGIARSPVEQVG